MQFIQADVERRVAGLLMAVGQSPLSWVGWSCLLIEIDPNSQSQAEIDADGCLFWVKSITESYLHNVDGHVYLNDGKAIHVVCRDVPHNVLVQVADHIAQILKEEDGIESSYSVFQLDKDGALYVDRVYQNSAGAFIDAIGNVVEITRTGEHVQLVENLLQGNDIVDADHRNDAPVILLDDDQVTRWMVGNVLEDKCDFEAFERAGQLFGKLPADKPCLLFLDINLPDRDGLSILDWVLEKNPEAYVVMFSSEGTIGNIEHALDRGAKGFIAKPFLREHLLYYVQNFQHKSTMQ